MAIKTIERFAGIVLAFVVVGFVIALVWRAEPIADPSLQTATKIILSLAVALLAGTIPGFLNMEYGVPGLAIRAGSGFALFLITFFGSPGVIPGLKPADLRVSNMPQIDLRTRSNPASPNEDRLKSEVVLTVPVSIWNAAQPAKAALLKKSKASLRLGNDVETFHWEYFVNMHEENYGVWLGLESSAQPQTIPSGGVLNKEILHASDNSVKWEDVLNKLQHALQGSVAVSLEFDEAETVSIECKINTVAWGKEIKEFINRTDRVPGRVTMECEDTP